MQTPRGQCGIQAFEERLTGQARINRTTELTTDCQGLVMKVQTWAAKQGLIVESCGIFVEVTAEFADSFPRII